MVYPSLLEAKKQGQKRLAILVDPDKTNRAHIVQLAEAASRAGVNYFFWGGSLVNEIQAEYYLSLLRAHTKLPIVLFPGSIYQLSSHADAILFLSLISGRNPELLIGQQVLAAPRIRRLGLEVMPTGYMLIDGGTATSVAYMSNTQPIPADKPEIACATALAGAMLGLQLIYLDAGSGARRPVHPDLIARVRREVDVPLIVGGGIRTPELATNALEAGADLIVVGNGLEKDLGWLPDLGAAVRASSKERVDSLP